ncbi:MAG TPA: dihydrofolate reductase family protein [Candidatus Kapabacteria bacterium]|nr:dihydrofolate reductase family protein [Candidatus Kapabacteria bacterium]
MRKLIVLSFITLDGVMQAPGGPEEDTSGGFKYGGWTAPFWDEFGHNTMVAQMSKNFDLLLGRKTYDIFAAYWPLAENNKGPIAAGLNRATKYVATHRPVDSNWEKTVRIGDNAVAEIKKLKTGDGPELQVHGSGNLIQTLLKHDLGDELWLKTFPVTLGPGKKLFAEGTTAAAFELVESATSPSGVIVANYKRAGEVKTGTL